MSIEITLIELANKINAHLAKGGLVMDAYRGGGQDSVTEACFEDWKGVEDGLLRLRCPTLSGWGSCIHDTDRLEIRGHEVHYFSGTDYCGKVVFLNPAPVDLNPRAADAGRAARIAYAAAICDYDDAVDARDAAEAAVNDARDALAASAGCLCCCWSCC